MAVALTGCADGLMHDEFDNCPTSEAMETSYIQLSFGMAKESLTRAGDPTGGEAGDGYEHGQSYEDEVSSVAVFLFKGYLNDAYRSQKVSMVTFSADVNDDDGNPEIDGGTTLSSQKRDVRYTTVVKKVRLYEGGLHHALVVANPSDELVEWAQDKFDNNNLTLGDLLDYIEVNVWTEEDGDYSDFVMSSHDDVEVELSGRSEDDPA
ncbi:MAG: hypothetical protein LUC33_03555, partial [Prevotellaceae bacterium]|nr:hypothetical protein [Prevotellaceae bacterium]